MKLQQSRPLHSTETVVTIDEKELPVMMQRVPFFTPIFPAARFSLRRVCQRVFARADT